MKYDKNIRNNTAAANINDFEIKDRRVQNHLLKSSFTMENDNFFFSGAASADIAVRS